MSPGEVLTYDDGNRPVCPCGWVGQWYPLGRLDTARSVLAAHQAVKHRPYCHQEVVDRDGFLDACNAPATTTRTDPEDGHQYPVCHMHRTRSPEGA